MPIFPVETEDQRILRRTIRYAQLKLEQHQHRQTYEQQCGPEVEQRYAEFAERFIEPQIRLELNMAALAQYMPEIYRHFINYQPHRFEPVFDGETFNILDLEEDHMVYPEDGVVYCLRQYEVFQTLPDVTQYVWEYRKSGHGQNYVHVKQMERMIPWWHRGDYIQKLNPGYLPEVVHTGIAVGVGLGVQLEEWVTHCRIKNLYVIEPEPDFFYASLFVADWSTILQTLHEQGACLHISLELNDKDAFDDLVMGMMANSYYGVSFAHLLIHYRSPVIDKFLEQLALKAHTLVSGFGFYDDSRIALAHAFANFGAGTPLCDGRPATALTTTPVILCANGPSLADLYPYLKSLGEKAVIVSCGTAISALYRAGIRPHIHVESERPYQTAVALDQIGDPEFLKGIMLLAPDVVHPAVVDKFGSALLLPKFNEAPAALLAEAGVAIAELMFAGPTVTNFALAALTHLGAVELYFVGTDFGFPNKEHHAAGSIYFSEDGEDKGVYNYEWHAKHRRPGNRGDLVETSTIFDNARLGVENQLRRYPGLRCANTARGALIAGAEPMAVATMVELLEGRDDIDWSQLLAKVQGCGRPVTSAVVDYARQVITSGVFEKFVVGLLRLLETPVANRNDALEQLQAVYREVVEVKGPHNRYLLTMLRGSVLYMSSFILKFSLWPKDSDEGLANYRDCIEVYRQYLQDIVDTFADGWQLLDDEDNSHVWQRGK
ncbi:MAG: motility associated factor glycosyltransferase family protein [Gammaproteobacteria bacterium]|nr:motility associated factor glycosyltransferase family protein [Gammaproteobacteria bacterium]